jgi:hypothetical protein
MRQAGRCGVTVFRHAQLGDKQRCRTQFLERTDLFRQGWRRVSCAKAGESVSESGRPRTSTASVLR